MTNTNILDNGLTIKQDREGAAEQEPCEMEKWHLNRIAIRWEKVCKRKEFRQQEFRIRARPYSRDRIKML